MDVVKVKGIVNAYCDAINVSEKVRNILIELMQNIITKYEKIVPYISVDIDTSKTYLIKDVDGKYSVEDFFLNRLMRNVWNIDEITLEKIKSGIDVIDNKGTYLPNSYEVQFNIPRLDRQVEKYRDVLGKDYEEVKKCSEKKVVMHEFEHALQTRFSDQLDSRYRSSYKKISDELSNLVEYKDLFRRYEDIPKETVEFGTHYFTGAYCSSKYQKGKKYNNINGYDNLNEILNESECLEMAHQKQYLVNSFSNSGNYYYCINPESSNSCITNYGYMFKEIFGSLPSFLMMYIDPVDGYQSFNDMYDDIFKEEYNSDKDAIEIFINAISEIKDKKKEELFLKLDKVMTKCFIKRVSDVFDNPKLSNNSLLRIISRFEGYLVTNNSQDKRNKIESLILLDRLKKMVINRNIDIEYENLIGKKR